MMTTNRRQFIALTGTALLTACATGPSMTELPPLVFVHGNGDAASIWQTAIWRFESNGWPRNRLHAIELPYPLARDDDTKAQPGRTSTAEHMAYLSAEVDRVLQATGAQKVVLLGNSRGGNAIRNYIQNGGGAAKVSHAVLGGVPNHGIWVSLPGLSDNSEFSASSAFLRGLNAPKNASGDEVTGLVKWLTLRSDNNDKYAQPDGQWVGKKGVATGVGYDGPALKGATNIVLHRADHRETSFSRESFSTAYRFITGMAPATLDVTTEPTVMLSGKVTGMGLTSTDPASGNFSNNLPLPGALVRVHAIDAGTALRERPMPVYEVTVGADGRWGPFRATEGTRYEFVVSAPGYATTHIYRSPFPRSSNILNLRPERIAAADRDAPSLVIMSRPRGYLDPERDTMSFDGRTPPPGALPGAGVASSRIKPEGPQRTVVAEFNGERVVGRSWPMGSGEVAVLELTY